MGSVVSPAREAKSRPEYAIASVDHALRLAAILQLEGTITVSQAAARLDVAPSTAHRLLAMLVYRDFAARHGRSYRVGPVLAQLSNSPEATARLRSAAEAPLTRLMEAFNETATLSIRTGRTVRFISEVECTHTLRVDHRTGMVFPAHRTSGGLALLADLPDAAIEELYAPDRVTAGEDAPNLDWLMSHVRSVRQQGFALNNGLSERGVLALGHSVRGQDAEPVAAVSIGMPSSRFQPTMVRPLVAALKQAAREIRQGIGSDI